MNLTGRSAIITGANQGLGRAIAEHYVRGGAAVLLVARGEALLDKTAAGLTPLATGPGQRVLAFRGDVAEPESCAAAVAFAPPHLPHLSILVSNARSYRP